MTIGESSIRQLLDGLSSLAGPLPAFDTDAASADPTVLFEEWLRTAIEAGVVEPHAMTLSTVDPQGRPSARVLILKGVRGDNWQFASGATSRKGKELANTPWAALTFYWPELGRQVRVRGAVTVGREEENAQDYLNRSPAARAVASLGMQSERLGGRQELDLAVDKAAERIALNPDLVSPEWTVYAITADEVEFWQGNERRVHTRLRYQRTGGEWTRHLLWP